MSDYLERYRASECKSVWTELLQHGDAVRTEPLLGQAQSVCAEFVDRCLKNLQMLRSRLLDLGYRFRNPDDALVEATAADARAVDQVEARMGVMPLVAACWYRRIASVDFAQEPD